MRRFLAALLGVIFLSTPALAQYATIPGASLGVNNFNGQQTINDPTANEYGLKFTPQTITSGTQGFGVNLVGTINDSTAVDGALWFSNVTCTLCTATTYLIDMQRDAVSRFRLDTSGSLTITGSLFTAGSVFAAAGGQISWTGNEVLTSTGASILQLGPADASSLVGQTVQAQSINAGTSNTAGGNWTFKGSRGTGTGIGGQLIFQTAVTGTTGTAVNALVTAATIDGVQHVTLGGGTPTCGTGCSSIAANATDQRMAITSGAAVTAVTVNFAKTWINTPICVVNTSSSTDIPSISAISATAFTVTTSAVLTGTIYAICQ